MKRTAAFLAFSLLTSASASVLSDLQNAQSQVIAYLPALKSQPVALTLKKLANNGINVFVIAPKQAHLAQDTYLLSLILAAAQTPPAALNYHRATIQAPPFLLIDNSRLYLGQGIEGVGPVSTGNPAQLKEALGVSLKVINSTPEADIRLLMKEKYGWKK